VRLKLDENLDLRLVPFLAAAGHDVDSVRDEKLSGQPDRVIYETCRENARTLVTLDLDFSNPLRFPPAPSGGIVVLRPPRPVLPMIRATLASVLPDLSARSLQGRLWIVEPGRIRLYDPPRKEEAQEEGTPTDV